MGVLNRQITVSKQAYEERIGYPMSQSLQDAYNDILSNFSETEVDKNYNSEMNQYLKNEKGDIYYFDNFKYVYPKQISNNSEVRVLNSNVGANNFCSVKYNGASIIVQNYIGYETVEISSYFLTEASRKLIASDYMKGDMGDFLLQISGNNLPCVETLHLGSKIVVKKSYDQIISYDINGNVIDTVSSTGGSFYSEVEGKVNYYNLLDKTYPLLNSSDAIDNQGPVR